MCSVVDPLSLPSHRQADERLCAPPRRTERSTRPVQSRPGRPRRSPKKTKGGTSQDASEHLSDEGRSTETERSNRDAPAKDARANVLRSLGERPSELGAFRFCVWQKRGESAFLRQMSYLRILCQNVFF